MAFSKLIFFAAMCIAVVNGRLAIYYDRLSISTSMYFSF